MINKKIIASILGFLLLTEAIFLLCCSGVSLLYGEDDLRAFLYTVGLCIVSGGILIALGKGAKRTLSHRDGYVIVTLAWLVFTTFGMLPFIISGYIPSPTNAFFEVMSGFTSTGATILDNIEKLPHGLLFWRGMTQWVGGMGIVFFTVAVLPIYGGGGGVQVFAAETSGVTKDKVHPRIDVTAKWIWGIYTGLTTLLVILLTFGGMSVFDSICHAFATTSTGGFSTKQASVAYYHSPYIEYVISIFMFISGTNFTLLLFFVTGRLRKVFSNAELKWYFVSVMGFTLVIAAVLHFSQHIGIEKSFRDALFQVVSLHTSTGFVTTDYMLWKPVLWVMLTIVMVIGACAGSTTGGLKCIRMLIITKVSKNELKHLLHPNAVLPVRVNKQVLPPTLVSSVLAFAFIYMMLIVFGTVSLMFMNVGPIESLGVTVSSLGNMGPGLGMCGPAYSWNALPAAGKWILSFLMMVGRLELFTVLLMFSPAFWKKN